MAWSTLVQSAISTKEGSGHVCLIAEFPMAQAEPEGRATAPWQGQEGDMGLIYSSRASAQCSFRARLLQGGRSRRWAGDAVASSPGTPETKVVPPQPNSSPLGSGQGKARAKLATRRHRPFPGLSQGWEATPEIGWFPINQRNGEGLPGTARSYFSPFRAKKDTVGFTPLSTMLAHREGQESEGRVLMGGGGPEWRFNQSDDSTPSCPNLRPLQGWRVNFICPLVASSPRRWMSNTLAQQATSHRRLHCFFFLSLPLAHLLALWYMLACALTSTKGGKIGINYIRQHCILTQ